MLFKMTVIKETQGGYPGKRGFVTTFEVTGSEVGPNPLLQLVDYQLREEEKAMFGRLVGKPLEIAVTEVRSIFSGRPRFSGQLVNVDGKPVAVFAQSLAEKK